MQREQVHQHRQAATETVSPFHWRQFTEREEGPGRPARPRAKAERPASARDRAERILAHRWSGAYSRA